MSFTRKHPQVDFSLATGNFGSNGNSYSAEGCRITAEPGSQDVATLMSAVTQKADMQFENDGVDVKIRNPYLPGAAI